MMSYLSLFRTLGSAALATWSQGWSFKTHPSTLQTAGAIAE